MFAIAAAICAIPAALVPLAGRSAREWPPAAAVVGNSFELSPVRTPAPPLDVRIARDPFIPDRLATQRRPALRSRAGSSLQDCTAPTVRGVAIGERPQAIVACGERIELIGNGDRLDGARVTSITSSGVVLSGGAVLPLSEDGE
ncbi:MAG TPA: hypothetical protein VFE17_13465 [Candidatus Baltobacteraceae bacterium]|nr:hypothetical protein [Candidatus Baltobacteraceae bacterium]